MITLSRNEKLLRDISISKECFISFETYIRYLLSRHRCQIIIRLLQLERAYHKFQTTELQNQRICLFRNNYSHYLSIEYRNATRHYFKDVSKSYVYTICTITNYFYLTKGYIDAKIVSIYFLIHRITNTYRKAVH